MSVLREFPIPTLQSGQDSQLFEVVVNLTTRLLNEELNEVYRADVLSSIDDKVCKLYGISQSELSQS